MWRTAVSQTLSAEDLPLVQYGPLQADERGRQTCMHHRDRAQPPTGQDRHARLRFADRADGSARCASARGTRQIVRYHDMIPILQTDTTPHAQDIRWHHHSIRSEPGQHLRLQFGADPDKPDRRLSRARPASRHDSVHAFGRSIGRRRNPSMVKSIISSRRSMATGVRPRRPLEANCRATSWACRRSSRGRTSRA